MSTATTSIDIEDVLARLFKVRQTGPNQYTACCPAHEDRNPSLSVGLGDDGKLLMYCHAGKGCDYRSIMAALHFDDGSPESQESRPAGSGRTFTLEGAVRVYDYTDAKGAVLYKVGRYDGPKDFRPFQPDGRGGWKLGLDKAISRVPYHLPRLRASAASDALVLHLEGEKDVERAEAEGFAATTTQGGAKNWRQHAPIMAKELARRRVLIIPDADDPGEGYAAAVLATLRPVAKAVAILRLPRLEHRREHGEDLGDWLDRHGGSAEELRLLAEAALADVGAGGEHEEQNEAEPTPAGTDGVLPFPLETLPTAVQTFARSVAKAIPCAVDLPAVGALVAAGAAIGKTRVLEIKPGWREAPRLWAIEIARPGDGKSPSDDKVIEPLAERQAKLWKVYEQARDAYYGTPKEDREGLPPKMEQVYVTDATLEALSNVILASPRGVLFYRDEISGWVRSMDQYKGGKGSDRQSWESLWNGAPVTINRVTRQDPVHLRSPFVAVFGGIQPDMLGELADEQGREDGFLHRLLFSYPDPVPSAYTKDAVSEGVMTGYANVLRGLWALHGEPDPNQAGAMVPRVVRFTAEGEAEWERWARKHAEEMNAKDLPDTLRGPWSKFKSYCARLALVVHLLRVAAGEQGVEDQRLDAKSVASAADLIDFFKSHARRVYTHLGASPEDKLVIAVRDWMRRHKQARVTARELQQAHLPLIKTVEDAIRVFNRMAALGYGTVTSERVRGGKRVIFEEAR